MAQQVAEQGRSSRPARRSQPAASTHSAGRSHWVGDPAPQRCRVVRLLGDLLGVRWPDRLPVLAHGRAGHGGGA